MQSLRLHNEIHVTLTKMATFRHDCPHERCRTRSTAFETFYSSFMTTEGSAYVMAVCGRCYRPTLFVIKGHPRSEHHVSEMFAPNAKGDPFARVEGGEWLGHGIKGLAIVQTFPAAPANAAPNHVPPNPAAAFVEGLMALEHKLWSSAAFNFRRALELAVDELDSVGKGSLYERIADLDASRRLPPGMVALAHKVRVEANKAVHREDSTEDQARQLADFTRLFFVYTFTLPTQIAEVAPEPSPARLPAEAPI